MHVHSSIDLFFYRHTVHGACVECGAVHMHLSLPTSATSLAVYAYLCGRLCYVYMHTSCALASYTLTPASVKKNKVCVHMHVAR